MIKVKNKNKKILQQKGITLVALVITIIILLILSGIAISALSGSGLFEKAKLAKEKQENAQIEENARLEEYTNLIDDYTGNSGIPEELSAEEISFTPTDTNWNVKNLKEALDYLYNN